MKLPGYLLRLLFTGLVFISSFIVLGEGTKELWPPTHLSDSCKILIAKGTVSTQVRDSFAVYGASPSYRLYIHIEDYLHEKIYFGLGKRELNGTVSNIRVQRPDATGTAIYTSALPIAGNPGYITTYTQAINGPNIISASGYDPIVVTPDMNGDYFFSFEVPNNSSRIFQYFDITVANPATSTAIPGRVFSRCWQLSNPGNGTQYPVFWGQMFIYSNDGITTKLDPNGMQGRDFSFSANESGCFKIDATHNAQQARRSQLGPSPHNYPQFKIFLNNPDIAVYPDGVIGQLVDGSVVATPNCNGSIDFSFETTPLTALGTVEITLELSAIVPQPIPNYADRVLIINNVPGGLFSVNWDGKDANGVPVAVGSTFPFTLRYTKGLTNLPLWDVEDNINGFKVNLVRPALTPPLPDPAFYWDDQLINGSSAATVNTTPPGCTSVSGCHGWGNNSWPNPYNGAEWGDQRTINTWWYLVSNSTQPVTVTFIHSPGTLTPLTPPTDICQGHQATFTVSTDPYSTSYHWVYDWGSQTTATNTLTLTIPVNATPGLTHMYVNGANANCPDGPVLDIPYTIHALPNGTLTGSASACLNSTQTYFTAAAMSGYNWTVTGGNTTAGGTATSDFVTVTWTTLGTGHITVTFTDPFGCGTNIPGSKDVTVNAPPVPLITGGNAICVNTLGTYSTDNLMSGYTWSVSAGGSIQTGQGTNSIDVLWNNTLNQSVSVYYTDLNGCTNVVPTIKTIIVNPRPVPVINGTTGICLNLTGTYTTDAGMSNYVWNVPAGGTLISGQGTKTATVQWTSVGNQIVTVTYDDANGCAPYIPSKFPVTVNPLPDATITGLASVCQDFPTLYSYQTAIIDPLATYSWQILSGNGTITPSTASNPVNINWNASGTAKIQVTTTTSPGCTDSKTFDLTINPKPDVSMVMCFDNITNRSAKRFLLKGGRPLYTAPATPVQGDYLVNPATPALQFDAPSGNYYFYPSLVPGNTTQVFNITYQYTNQFGCPNKTASPGIAITVQAANPACGASMTDPRDGKTYTTALFAGQCWMTQNLNFPKAQAPLSDGTPQTDNCIVEKYCPASDATCSSYGGYYQWDELVQFGMTDYPYQGLCPPGWHIPTEAEWQTLINLTDPAFTAPKADALMGAYLKDPLKSFGAQVKGVYYMNDSWAYNLPSMAATMFWTSTQDGNSKAVARGLNDPYNPSISKYSASRANAFPVRCVKD